MPSNKNTQSKKPQMKSTEQTSAPVVQEVAAPVAPVVQEVAAPVVQQGGKGKAKGKAAAPQQAEAAPVVAAPVVAAPVVAAPVVAAPVEAAPAAQEGGAKKAKGGKKAVAPAAAPVVAEVAQTAGAKVAKAPKAKAAKAKEPKAAKVKAAAKPKVAKPKVVKPKAATETAEDGSEEAESGKRSFKAKLPESDKFEGRYTGLTPYQAANKALSKYYREHSDNAANEITFSIRESTRGSKRSEYTYNGRREKLAVPVEYTIKGKDGDRTVVKEYKNRLTKVKKADSTATATETATASA